MQFSGLASAVLFFILLNSATAWSVTKYHNLENSTAQDDGVTGWGSCIECAGGGSVNATIASAPFHTTPSKDGTSRDFLISGDAYSNALWWYKVGPNNSASNFSFDFWLNVDSGTPGAQALEFDTFQMVGGREYMFGTQCDYALEPGMSGTQAYQSGHIRKSVAKLCSEYVVSHYPELPSQ